jgi:hypothetical protein
MNEKQYLEVNIATNFNNKLNGDYFIHIAPMPPKPSDEKVSVYASMLGRLCEMKCKDMSMEPVKCQIVDWLAEYQVRNIPEIFIILSHGKRRAEFQQEFLQNFRSLNAASNVAIYYFKKLKE